MNYKEIIGTLFTEFRGRAVPVAIHRAGKQLVEASPLLDREELFIICRTGLPDMNGEHYRSLEVTTPHEFENRLGSELNNERYKTLLYIRSNVYPGSDSEPGQEQIWLNYSGLSGRDFNPAVHGSERILAIHVRLQELLKSASPLVVAELKRSQQAKA